MNEYTLGDVRYFIDHEKRILYASRHDTITKEGIFAEWKAVQDLDGFDPSYETIVDYSYVPRVELDVSDVMELNRKMPDYDVRTSHVAIVSGLESGRFMFAKYACTLVNLVSRRKHQVFNTKAEAEVWLFSLRDNN